MKFLVVGATDGDETVAASAFYLLGVTLILIGSTWVGAVLAGDRPMYVLAPLVLLSPLLGFVSYAVLDGIAAGIAGNAGPDWLKAEVGIVATGAAWLGASLWALRRHALEPRHQSAR